MQLYTAAIRKWERSAPWIPIQGSNAPDLNTSFMLLAGHDLQSGDIVRIASETDAEIAANDTFEPSSIRGANRTLDTVLATSIDFLPPYDSTLDGAWSASAPGFVVPTLSHARLKTRGDLIRYLVDDIALLLINTNDGAPYVFNPAHEFRSDITGANAVVADSVNNTTLPFFLHNKATVVTGTGPSQGVALSAATFTFEAVPAGPYGNINAVILYKSTGTPSTSPLIGFLDNFTAAPNGGNVPVGWSGLDTRILRIRGLC